jgi:hypothetical protein
MRVSLLYLKIETETLLDYRTTVYSKNILISLKISYNV